MRRRDLLVMGGLVGLAVAIPPYLRRRGAAFEFEPLAGFDGYRRLVRGQLSSGFDIFAGLTPPPEPLQPPTGPLCVALFGPETPPPGTLPIAVFGDINCPNCLSFDGRLTRLRDADSTLRIIHHQLPLLGDRSVAGARIILAAGLQGKADDVYRDLLRSTLRPGPTGARAVAARHGLDADQLWSDARSPQVADLLGKALGLGAALGIPGTPSAMIGRTLVIGALPEPDLARLIALEKDRDPLAC